MQYLGIPPLLNFLSKVSDGCLLSNCSLQSVEGFTPPGGSGSALTWHPVADMNTSRCEFSATVLEDQIFVAGLTSYIVLDRQLLAYINKLFR